MRSIPDWIDNHNGGLDSRICHMQRELLGGEQQRVAIARVLINNPSIILADKPCANLDYENLRNVMELFQTVKQDMGQTIVIVTHENSHKNTSTGLFISRTECRILK